MQNLATKLCEQNQSIKTNKQELCGLSKENFNLKSRIVELEANALSMDKSLGSISQNPHGESNKENPLNSSVNVNSIIITPYRHIAE
jgi:hypothetical protein